MKVFDWFQTLESTSFFFFNLVVLIIFSLTEYGNTSSESDRMFLLVFCQEMHLMWCLTIIDPM